MRRGRLENKVAVVIGAAGDIGLETCICLAREGASLLMAGRDLAKLNNAAAHVLSQVPDAPRVAQIQCDIQIEADVERLFNYLDAWGGADIVFNNAGICSDEDGDAVDVTEAAWDLTLQINLKGTWFSCKHAILSFRKNRKTRTSVINNAGIVALVGSAVSQLAYTASKGAIVAMTRELAIVHAREGFRFNTLCPGPVLSKIVEEKITSDPVGCQRRAVHWPMNRLSLAMEQAMAVVFLASDESSFVNATDFVVDGGLTKAYVCAES